jgi:hypothetical protein
MHAWPAVSKAVPSYFSIASPPVQGRLWGLG